MDTTTLIEKSRSLITDKYVFPEVAAAVDRLLANGEATGRYRDASPAELAALVTEDLQTASNDKHLRLLFHAEEVPDLPSEEMTLAMFRRDAARSMNGLRRIELLDDNIAVVALGVLYDAQIAGDAFAAAMSLVGDADGLILDARSCPGGSPGTVALICSYLFGDEPVHLNNMYERAGDRTTQSWTQPYVPGRRFGPEKPICVLTSANTFSGGEELAYDLQQLGRATIVGETTGGGANPRDGFRLDAHLELAVPTARAVNPVSGTNWEGVGVVPDIAVPADRALGTALELLRKATAGE